MRHRQNRKVNLTISITSNGLHLNEMSSNERKEVSLRKHSTFWNPCRTTRVTKCKTLTRVNVNTFITQSTLERLAFNQLPKIVNVKLFFKGSFCFLFNLITENDILQISYILQL